MQLFYIPDISEEDVCLSEAESKHCIRVLRLNTGDKIQLIDGKGGFYEAQIFDPNPKKCLLKIVSSEQEFEKKNFYLHIAIAPTKNNDRFEWFLEKATEIGIDEITPLSCRFSERKSIKPDRLQKIIVSAMKQSLKAYLPKLNPMVSFNQFITSPFDCKKYIAHCYEGEKNHLKNRIKEKKKYIILIGPEGDFSKEEVNLALEQGFEEITLGKSRLRTETAGIVACNIVTHINE